MITEKFLIIHLLFIFEKQKHTPQGVYKRFSKIVPNDSSQFLVPGDSSFSDLFVYRLRSFKLFACVTMLLPFLNKV